MYISQIIIKNYRGVKNETLNFTNFNTLVGKNDCGKSTIINAIQLFVNDEKVSQKDFNYYQQGNKDIEITITLSEFQAVDLKPFLIKGEKEEGFNEIVQDYVVEGKIVIKKKWAHKDKGEITSQTELKVEGFQEYKLHESKSSDINNWIKEFSVDIPVNGTGNNSDLEKKACLRQKLFELGKTRSTSFFEIKHRDIKPSLPLIEIMKADQSIETTTTEFKGTFRTEVREIIKKEKENDENSTLAGIEEKITAKIKEEAQTIKACMAEHISDLSEIHIMPSFSWEKGVEITNVEIQLEGDEKPIPLENKGSGYRRLFMVGRLRYLADKKQSENVIYLVEEPETFLHPSAQEEMLHSLISLSDSNQVIITTHSPIFTGATKQNAITLCTKENTELKYEQRTDDAFLLDIAKQLGVKPSHNILDTYQTIVFVEGPSDRAFLKIASEKLSKELHTHVGQRKIAIIEGGGSSLSNFIDIEYFEKQEKQMFLIIDSDIYDEEQITNLQTQKDLNRKILANKELQRKFNEKNKAVCFILKKKNIEAYCHPHAIKRLHIDFPERDIFPDNFCLTTYLRDHRPLIKGNLGKKNIAKVYQNMEENEWQATSNAELEEIFEEISQSVLD